MSRLFQFSLRALLVAALVATAWGSYAVDSDDGDDVTSILKKLEAAKWAGRYRPDGTTCKWVSGLYRSLFAAAGAGGLPTLQTLPDDSIAIQAAWESVALTVPAEMRNELVRLDGEKLNGFLGFLEGRARVSLPEGWRELVLNARTNRRDSILPGEPKENPYHEAGAGSVKCPTNASVEIAGKAVVYRVADDTITVPEKIVKRDLEGDLCFNFSGCFTSERCFLAVHDTVGSPHDVACIDRLTGKLVWTSQACGYWWGPFYGTTECWVWVVMTNNGRVFVFGAGSCGFYVHCFDASDGKSLGHFSSGY